MMDLYTLKDVFIIYFYVNKKNEIKTKYLEYFFWRLKLRPIKQKMLNIFPYIGLLERNTLKTPNNW